MKILNFLYNIIPHIHFVMIVIFVTLLIVDICNPFMDFINNDITKGILWFYCALSATTGGVMLAKKNVDNKKREPWFSLIIY